MLLVFLNLFLALKGRFIYHFSYNLRGDIDNKWFLTIVQKKQVEEKNL